MVGFYRRDPTRRIVLVGLPALMLTLAGALLVGWSWVRIEVADPSYAEAARWAEERPPPPIDDPRAPVDHPVLGGGFAERRVQAAQHRQELRERLQRRGELGSGWTWLVFVLGLLSTAAGPLTLILALRKLWRDDNDLLLLDTAGFVHQARSVRRRVRWDEIERIAHDEESGAVVVTLRDDSADYRIEEPFADTTQQELAKHLEQIRRKAIHDLLPQQRR